MLRDSGEEEGENLDIKKIIGDGYFQDEQKQEPLFQNIWQSKLAKDEGGGIDPWKMKESPWFEVRGDILYQVKDQEDGEERHQILVPQRYWEPCCG